jgi:putative sigma-54 modulation protein
VDVSVSGRNVDVSDQLRLMAEEKIGKLDRFLRGLDRAEVHFIEEKNPRIEEREICEVTLEGHGHHVRCKVRGVDEQQALDRAVDKLEHQLHKLKTKKKRYDKHAKRGHGIEEPEAMPVLSDPETADEEVAAELGYRIVKVKHIEVDYLTPSDAALQMDLVNHPFYFFTDRQTGKPAVVYRRDDGDVGLLISQE